MSARMLSALLSALLLSSTLACGPGGVDDGPPPAEPEWAYGWWMAPGGLNEHAEWGPYALQLEIRADGTVHQIVDYCNGPDWVRENPWELRPDGAIRILPASGQSTVLFQDPYSLEYEYVDLRLAADSCEIVATRVRGTATETTLERGHWCIGEVIPEFNTCAPQQYCGEPAPTCE